MYTVYPELPVQVIRIRSCQNDYRRTGSVLNLWLTNQRTWEPIPGTILLGDCLKEFFSLFYNDNYTSLELPASLRSNSWAPRLMPSRNDTFASNNRHDSDTVRSPQCNSWKVIHFSLITQLCKVCCWIFYNKTYIWYIFTHLKPLFPRVNIFWPPLLWLKIKT